MKTYILSIAGIILLSSVVSIIVPNGKMGSFMKGVMRLLILVVIVTPMISLMQSGELNFTLQNYSMDESFLEYCVSIASSDDETYIAEFLFDEYGVIAEIKTVRSIDHYTIKKITANVWDLGIFGQDEHIDNIGHIKMILEEKYGCEAEVYDTGKSNIDLEK